MLVLLIRAVTLEGASKGILFFLTPQWHELTNPKVNTFDKNTHFITIDGVCLYSLAPLDITCYQSLLAATATKKNRNSFD